MLWVHTPSVKRSIVCSLVIYITRLNVLNVYMGSRTFRNPLTPPNGGRFPRKKNYTCQGPQAHNNPGSHRGSGPPKGAKQKMCHAPKNGFSPFSRKPMWGFSPNFVWVKGTPIVTVWGLLKKIVDLQLEKIEIPQNFTFGGLPPKWAPRTVHPLWSV